MPLARVLRRVSLTAAVLAVACAPYEPPPVLGTYGGSPLIGVPSVGAAAVALRRADELRLSPDQRTLLESIRRTVDSVNAPLKARLDSLRPSARPINPMDLSPEQRADIDRRRAASIEVLKQMRANAARYRARTLALLTPEQQASVIAWDEEEEKADPVR